MQWKDVDCPTSAEICNSAINWLDYRNSFLLRDAMHPWY